MHNAKMFDILDGDYGTLFFLLLVYHVESTFDIFFILGNDWAPQLRMLFKCEEYADALIAALLT